MHYLIIIIVVWLCTCLQISRMTKTHKNYKKRRLDHPYYANVAINLLVSLGLFAVFCYKYPFSTHGMPKLQNIVFYLLITDALYYWIHRIIHKTPALKKFFHYTHHEAIHLVPMDVYYTSHNEHILYHFILCIFPLLFVHLNFIEYIMVLLISQWHTCYAHSEIKNNFMLPLFIDSKYHKKHHRIGGGNYSIFFNIWDEYMGSKIKSNAKPKNKNKNKNKNKPK